MPVAETYLVIDHKYFLNNCIKKYVSVKIIIENSKNIIIHNSKCPKRFIFNIHVYKKIELCLKCPKKFIFNFFMTDYNLK